MLMFSMQIVSNERGTVAGGELVNPSLLMLGSCTQMASSQGDLHQNQEEEIGNGVCQRGQSIPCGGQGLLRAPLCAKRGGNFSSETWEIFCRENDGGCFPPSGNDSAVLHELSPEHHALSVTPSAKS